MQPEPPGSAPSRPARRLLLVHAHPDDEAIGTGATMAYYAAAGAGVTLVTCTLGEEGEIHVPALRGLAAAKADQLGGYRITELAAACAALGVSDHRFLGGAGRYRDSGMMGLPTNDHPRAFWRADLDEAAGHLVEIMREVRPQVLVTYDPNGFYGHPDHIQAHRVAMRAAELAAAEGFGPDKIYWTAMPRSVLEAGLAAFAEAGDNPFAGTEQADDLPFGTLDEQIAARIDGTDQHAAKEAAMRAHGTQIPDDSWLYSIASNFGGEFMGVEYYTLAVGNRGPGAGPYDWEDDLFAGLPDASADAAPSADPSTDADPDPSTGAGRPDPVAVVPTPPTGTPAEAGAR
ncbi:N-acetyl-1-D-myo-inositol-2-amino-2-deoxy-alpha-D-glucopyranoside deacetylase [Micromonospora sp. WMMD1102]|uniref:N-acetyl-1-D-myo-inositol-2-amino-2-deoxy-alpha- D-glucopyranoside deacetylase n=1 Tax=Micromonospora sp. WMMD1102 TaxID=3016105 RepID=UPI002415514C|nr:N-acetyl-1-D-myo-inositol-2-amino-2-deoxy-alpha-D-glucopyranoside deacetylase [Micromonospora sp. WMMD1102]MDG4784613.1 N-acetyl-1-D-myo-inositol-2-amino-2-deoxy-alpha-D-glucopyranoside deacetylase [Micromonospora sp. WMMD1102]